MANKQTEICFLCGKTKSEVNQLLKGKFGYICDSCVNEAHEVLNEQEEEEISHNVQLAT
ncbi:ClpX C4-type zinc finger protein, partial [Parablautia intestinalis]|uniref:ClpX C4-type zinc finger protein n=1 Tax=Parablautia intestinalis TaxID=2320100 RepID=UPI003AB93BBE